MPTTFNVLFLGNFADIDPDEGNGDYPNNPASAQAENASSLVGKTFGTSTNPLATEQSDFQELSAVSFAGGTGDSSDELYDQSQESSSDTFRIDNGPVQTFDSLTVYDATLTYTSGSTNTITAVIFQDTDGNTYLAPELSANQDQVELEQGPIESIELDSVDQAFSLGLFADRQAWDISNICFARGTRIKTVEGEIAIEELAVGDRVLTMDAGYQPIRWIGGRKLDKSDLDQHLHLKPIRIRAGSLGPNLPEADLLVSPQHRILVRSKIAHRMFDAHEVLIPAKKLLPLDGIDIEWEAEEVEYFHMLFDAHQLVWSNGTVTESLFTGPEALKAVSPEAREEIALLFPHILQPDFEPTSARPIPEKGKHMKKLVQRLAKNNKAPQEIHNSGV